MAELQKKVWTGQVMKRFYPDTSFLKYAKDFSTLVTADKLNFTEVGADPAVLINNTTYPINVVQQADTPIDIELDKFETENTLIRNPEVIEYSYDKLEVAIQSHREALRAATGRKAAHAYAPAGNSTYTPVIATTGATDNGRKRLTIADVLKLQTAYGQAEMPEEDRFLVLHPLHVEDLLLEDTKAFKDMFNLVDGKPRKFASFNMLQFSRMPIYNVTTLAKVPLGAAAAPATDTFASFAFIASEVMKADGQIKMYSKIDDPEERASIIGFDKRFIALPIRNKGNGAIVSALV